MAKRKYTKNHKRDIYQEITDRILAMLETGTVPWRNPLRRQGGGGWPKNLDSMKRYRGINVFLLAVTAWERGYGSDYWLTFRQAVKQGGKVKKGEKASLVTFWKLFDKTDKESGQEYKLPVLRHYNVFNAQQCEGIQTPDLLPPDPDAPPFEPLSECEAIVAGYKDAPPIEHQAGPARYRPSADRVLIPKPDEFDTRENYYAVLFHELVHSSGHKSRLDRGFEESPAPFGSPDYCKEELVAEMGAAFLAAAGGISPPTIEQSAAYIDNWQKQLRGDARLIVTAAGAAQKAADFIFGASFEEQSPTQS
ncbi:ArdC family protein [Adhaeretor mobilis]|uniref:DNA primase TraC n=1 Tax=Adhaeretor mobilis TaxID=1930276 RepID=A0A517MZW1_9BACT|nr:ArdC-like ssDNA-binding domain-containing protein [Adhaeretor mobilis]QDT00415.1 DNA primase TraC [Adhaeretor mobilis]